MDFSLKSLVSGLTILYVTVHCIGTNNDRDVSKPPLTRSEGNKQLRENLPRTDPDAGDAKPQGTEGSR
jgi:hypothetical protein